MTYYRLKPTVYEAYQWFKNGDHPKDGSVPISSPMGSWLSEGKVVRRYNNPTVPGQTLCGFCELELILHGWIDTVHGGLRVCPGDFILNEKGNHSEFFPCKEGMFKFSYEPVEQ
jgi:hypothetical protein